MDLFFAYITTNNNAALMFSPHIYVLIQNIRKSNPGMAFTEMGRALGERWRKMTGNVQSIYISLDLKF